ncbi:hypothetical protein CR513_45381, partial [Mucuna pruriens]
MKTWHQIAPDSRTWEKKNKKASKNTSRGAQFQPLIIEREMVTMFIDTLLSSYYDRIVGNVASNFANLVVVGKRIELGIQQGKFAQTSNNACFVRKPTLEKKKGETNVVLVELVFYQTKTNAPSYPTRIQVGSRSTTTPLVSYISPCPSLADAGAATTARPMQQNMRRPPRALAPIPMTYTELLPLLLE